MPRFTLPKECHRYYYTDVKRDYEEAVKRLQKANEPKPVQLIETSQPTQTINMPGAPLLDAKKPMIVEMKDIPMVVEEV